MEEILEKIENLDEKCKKIFDRIYEIKVEEAEQYFPHSLKENFKEAEKQKIIIFKNKILEQETHFNIWRAKRTEPIKKEEIEEYDPFCNVKEKTPYDDLGRLENERAITASNLAKVSRDHSLIIFKDHKIENISNEDIKMALELSIEWFEKKKSKIKVLIWNLGYRAGASIKHPHFQVFSFDDLPTKIDFIYKKIKKYKENFNSDYFEDLFEIHQKLGLAKNLNEIKIIINLTPFKDNEVIFLFDNLEKNLSAIAKLLEAYFLTCSGNFNLLVCDSARLKIGFLVDRGESKKINSDIGSLEIYAFSVVGRDILEFVENLFRNLH